MGVYEKLLEIQTRLKVPKNQYNGFGKYKYRSCEDILEAVKPHLGEVKAVLLLDDMIELVGERYYVKATATFIDCEDPSQRVSVSASAREEESKKGMDSSQVTGATSSYARKYALNGLLDIDDAKDSDATQGKEVADQRRESKPKTKKMSEDMSAKLNKAIRDYGEMTGKTNKEIMASIINEVGKRPDTMDDADGERVLNLMKVWGNKYLDELGA